MLARVASGSQQPSVHIGTTARDFPEEEDCTVILSQKLYCSQCLSATHPSFPGNTFRFSLPRSPPNTMKSGKFNPLCYLQAVYPSYRVPAHKAIHKVHQQPGGFTERNNTGLSLGKGKGPLLLAPLGNRIKAKAFKNQDSSADSKIHALLPSSWSRSLVKWACLVNQMLPLQAY